MLLEHEAQRVAEALEDYEDVSVADIGGGDDSGYWLVVSDTRFDRRCEISSSLDYWNFIVGHALGRPLGAATSAVVGGAIGRPSGAAISAAEATA